MRLFKITQGRAAFGPGQKLALAAQQIEARDFALEDAREPIKGKAWKDYQLVTAKLALEFKAGEVIGLAELPKNLIGLAIDADEAEKAEKDAAAAAAVAKKAQDEADKAAADKKAKEDAAKLAAAELEQTKSDAGELVQKATQYLAAKAENITAEQKAEVEGAIALVTDALKGENAADIEAAGDALDETCEKVALELKAKADAPAGETGVAEQTA